jgi:hypothetical protein
MKQPNLIGLFDDTAADQQQWFLALRLRLRRLRLLALLQLE